MKTAREIIAGALAYNSEYPEAREEIFAGNPVILIHTENQGSGWTITATLTPGIQSESGFIAAADPIVRTFRARDGRIPAATLARREFKAELAGVEVPVF